MTTRSPLTILARDVALAPRIALADHATGAARRAEVVRLLSPYALTDARHQDLLLIRRTCEEVGYAYYGFTGLELVDALIADGHSLPRLRAEMAADHD